MATPPPDKAWLRRILTPTATTPLPAPDRGQKKPRDNAPARASASASSDTLPFASGQPAVKPPEVTASATPSLPTSPRSPNVGPGKGRVIKQSERLESARTALITQAHDMADAMPLHASEETRAELNALWRRIEVLGEEIERQQRVEDHDARGVPPQGDEQER